VHTWEERAGVCDSQNERDLRLPNGGRVTIGRNGVMVLGRRR